MFEHLARWMGLTDSSGGWYLFWSGIGGDFSELAIIGAILQLYRSKTCDIKKCHRLARYKVRDTEWTVCGKHTTSERPTPESLARELPDEVLPDDLPPATES